MPRNPVGIVLHTLATPRGWGAGKSSEDKLAEVTRWHTLPKPKGRGWRGIGYNWVVWIDGQESGGRDLDGDGDYFEEIGAHVRGMNATTIGIAMEPVWTDDHQDNGNPWDFFTASTLHAAEKRIRWLFRKYPTLKWVDGHNSFAAKACPQFRVQTWWDHDAMAFRRVEAEHVPVRPDVEAPEDPDWLAVQTWLKANGFPPGPLDGIRGPKTDNALAAYGLDEVLEQIG